MEEILLTMPIKDLETILSQLSPVLLDEEYVFCSLNSIPQGLKPLSTYQEKEGLSIICTETDAKNFGLAYESVFRCITLSVNSSLEAVGLTAAVANVLTTANISANVVAAYHHDHVFVPVERASEALSLIKGLSNTSS